MPQPVNFGNVSLTLQQFNEIASGKYNAGEVRLDGERALAKINNHVHFTGLNKVSLSHAEVLAIKIAFVKALSQNGVQGCNLDCIRQELGLEAKHPNDLQLSQRSLRPLSRQQIREILDSNADAINAAQGSRTIRTDAEMHAKFKADARAEIEQTRLATNRALDGQRATMVDEDVAMIQDVITGNVAFPRTPAARRALLDAVRRQQTAILERSNGVLSNAPNASFRYVSRDNGLDVEIKLGMSEVEYVDNLRALQIRLSSSKSSSIDCLTDSQRAAAAREISARFAPNGAATRRALQMGYFQSEINMLRRVAEIYQAATGCAANAAVAAALDPTSAARRLFSYGGRFTASAANFRDGLGLMYDFKVWFTETCAQVSQGSGINGHLPAGANLTAINANSAFFKPRTSRAYEKFLFEEIAGNGAIPLASDDPNRIFGMEANPATRFVGRGYVRAAARTLLQIPPERRRVLYAVVDVLSPLVHTGRAADKDSLYTFNCEIISRVMRRYDEAAAVQAAGQLTRANILTRLFPDIPNAVNMTNWQLKMAFHEKLDEILPRDSLLRHPILRALQDSGVTYNEAVEAGIHGKTLPFAPYISNTSCDLSQLDGTPRSGCAALFQDLDRPGMPEFSDGRPALAAKNNVYKVAFPDGTVLRSVSGELSDPKVKAANTAITDKVAQFCGQVHHEQLSALYYALSQSGAGPVFKGLVQHGVDTTEHAPLTFTLSKNDTTGAITVRYSEPEGLPVRFHWETTIALDGSSTSTPLVVDP